MRKLVSFVMVLAILFSFSGCDKNSSASHRDKDEKYSFSKKDEQKASRSSKTLRTIHSSRTTKSTSTATKTTSSARPYDKNGTLYQDELEDALSDYGTIYWNYSEEYYVLNPRDTYRKVIYGLVADPFDSTYTDYWDLVTIWLQYVTLEYPSAVCVANPANPNAVLLIVVMGDVGYSVF